MQHLIEHDAASTPLTPEELRDLIPTYISQRRELNEIEQMGIDEADLWVFSRKRDVLTEAFLKKLHKRMFDKVWRWAGKFRTTPRNIGVDAWEIEPQLRILLDDTKYWLTHKVFTPDEIAIRFHHKLVWIHPFPNGNGRHARMAADVLVTQLGGARFTWGRTSLTHAEKTRTAYVHALQKADREMIEDLILFARS